MLLRAQEWLNRYFNKENPQISELEISLIGSAVGHNTLSIITPCHRVIASDGKIGGYAEGWIRKFIYYIMRV